MRTDEADDCDQWNEESCGQSKMLHHAALFFERWDLSLRRLLHRRVHGAPQTEYYLMSSDESLAFSKINPGLTGHF
jgi:hypothetical protein